VLTLAGAVASAAAQGEDSRKLLGGQNLEIRYWPEHEDTAYEVRQVAEDALKELTGTLDLDLKHVTVRVDIVRTQTELNDLAGVPAAAPAAERLAPWTLGVSLHHANYVILKPLAGKALRRLVVHELTHVALDLKMASHKAEAPRWVHEGLAQWMEGDMPAAQKDILGKAAVEGSLLTRGQLEAAFEGKRDEADLAYAESQALVEYMVEKGPPGALGRFLQFLMDTDDEDLALRRAMRQPLDVVEREWLSYTRAKYLTRGVPLTVDLLILGLMAAVFVVAVVVKLRAAREIRRRLQEEEQLRSLFQGVEPPDKYLEDTDDEWHLRE
jgi:hypothetical protein